MNPATLPRAVVHFGCIQRLRWRCYHYLLVELVVDRTRAAGGWLCLN